MSTTKPNPGSLLFFFKKLASKQGAVEAWAEFRSGAVDAEWGVLVFDPESETLQGAMRDHEPQLIEVSFFDWLSRRVRPEVHRALTAFGEALGACQVEDQARSLREAYVNEIASLKAASGSLHEDGVHQVLVVWLDRMNADVEALTSDALARRKRLGGASFDDSVDQNQIQRVVARVLTDTEYWHPASSKRTGPIVSKVQRAVEDELEDLIDRSSSAVRERVERAIMAVRTRGGINGPSTPGDREGDIDFD